MSTKHTKGQWFVERLDTMRVLEVAENTPVVSSGKYPNTFTHVVCLGGDVSALANAKLIAAAPELLQCLKDVLVMHKRIDTKEPDTIGELAEIEEKIQFYVHKAEGRL